MVKNLLAALAKAQAALTHIEKSGFNSHQNYFFVKVDDVVSQGRKALAEHGLLSTGRVVPGSVILQSRVRESKNGTAYEFYVSLTYELIIYHVETGESLAITAQGDGVDSQDKAVYKAQSGAKKYAWLSALAIPVGDDPEEERAADKENRGGYQQRQQRPPQRQPQRPQGAPAGGGGGGNTPRPANTPQGAAQAPQGQQTADAAFRAVYQQVNELMRQLGLTPQQAEQIVGVSMKALTGEQLLVVKGKLLAYRNQQAAQPAAAAAAAEGAQGALIKNAPTPARQALWAEYQGLIAEGGLTSDMVKAATGLTHDELWGLPDTEVAAKMALVNAYHRQLYGASA